VFTPTAIAETRSKSKTAGAKYPNNAKFLLMKVPPPLYSPSAAAMRRRKKRTSISPIKRLAPSRPRTTTMPLYRRHHLYQVFGTPPRFRHNDRTPKSGPRAGVYSSTPLPGRPPSLFFSKRRVANFVRTLKKLEQSEKPSRVQ
jgi:hypothetical protein